MTPPQEMSKGRTLHSWKEIAACLGVTVRSAQRWEQTAGLPVYRQGNGTKARVFAYSAELLRWREQGGFRPEEPEPAPPVRVSRRRFWYTTVAGAAAGPIAGVAAWRLGLFGAGVPADWVVERSVLRILDAKGKELWQKRLPLLSANFDSYAGDRVLISDLDGDGNREVLLNYITGDPTGAQDRLMCFDAAGRLRWEARYGAPKTFGERSFAQSFKGRMLRAVTVDGKRRVLAVANHYMWYPAQVALLDPSGGQLVEEYWHPGSIYHCIVRDIDGDGSDEAIIGAINNPGTGLGHAGVGILKFPLSGASKRNTTADDFPPPTGGGEAAYALLPQPDVNTVTGVLPTIREMVIDQRERIVVTMTVADGAAIYYLDFGLNVIEHRFYDGFESAHYRLHHQGLLDHALSDRELEALGKVARFPAAPDGNDPRLKKLWEF